MSENDEVGVLIFQKKDSEVTTIQAIQHFLNLSDGSANNPISLDSDDEAQNQDHDFEPMLRISNRIQLTLSQQVEDPISIPVPIDLSTCALPSKRPRGLPDYADLTSQDTTRKILKPSEEYLITVWYAAEPVIEIAEVGFSRDEEIEEMDLIEEIEAMNEMEVISDTDSECNLVEKQYDIREEPEPPTSQIISKQDRVKELVYSTIVKKKLVARQPEYIPTASLDYSQLIHDHNLLPTLPPVSSTPSSLNLNEAIIIPEHGPDANTEEIQQVSRVEIIELEENQDKEYEHPSSSLEKLIEFEQEQTPIEVVQEKKTPEDVEKEVHIQHKPALIDEEKVHIQSQHSEKDASIVNALEVLDVVQDKNDMNSIEVIEDTPPIEVQNAVPAAEARSALEESKALNSSNAHRSAEIQELGSTSHQSTLSESYNPMDTDSDDPSISNETLSTLNISSLVTSFFQRHNMMMKTTLEECEDIGMNKCQVFVQGELVAEVINVSRNKARLLAGMKALSQFAPNLVARWEAVNRHSPYYRLLSNE